MSIHELKCWPEPFEALLLQTKTHEYRQDDRSFGVGDVLVLREWRPNVMSDSSVVAYTGREIRRVITYVSRGPDYGIPRGFVVMSIAPDEDHPDPEFCEACSALATRHDVDGVPLCDVCYANELVPADCVEVRFDPPVIKHVGNLHTTLAACDGPDEPDAK